MITISKKLKLTVRVISLALVLCICLSVMMTPKAHAISELVIVGAIALTLSAVAAVVILAAEPLGLKEPIMAAAQHGFQSPREFVADLLDRYGASQGLQRFVLLDRFQKGLMITVAGKVILDKVVSDLLTDFFGWAWSETGGGLVQFAEASGDIFDISNIANPAIDLHGLTSVFAGQSLGFSYVALNGSVRNTQYSMSNGYMYLYITPSGVKQIRCCSLTPFTVSGSGYQTFNGNSTQTSAEFGTYYIYNIFNVAGTGINNYTSSLPANNIPSTTSGASTVQHLTVADYIILYGNNSVEPTYDNDGLVLPAPSTSNVLDVPGALTLPAPISGTTTATNYLEAAADAITAGTGSLEYEDTYGSNQTGTLEGTGEVGLTQVGTQSAELEGAIDIADSVGSETLDNYTIDLKSFFPFCIPFDLHDMLHLLESAPAPVSVEWQFDFGDLGEYEMEINLEEWNSVAQTLRTMELLAFCFGLAMLTKRILMGS